MTLPDPPVCFIVLQTLEEIAPIYISVMKYYKAHTLVWETCGRESKVARNKISRIRYLELSNQARYWWDEEGADDINSR